MDPITLAAITAASEIAAAGTASAASAGAGTAAAAGAGAAGTGGALAGLKGFGAGFMGMKGAGVGHKIGLGVNLLGQVRARSKNPQSGISNIQSLGSMYQGMRQSLGASPQQEAPMGGGAGTVVEDFNKLPIEWSD